MRKRLFLSAIDTLKLGHHISIDREPLVILGDFESPESCLPQRFMAACSPRLLDRHTFGLVSYDRSETPHELVQKLSSTDGIVILDPATVKAAFHGHYRLGFTATQRQLCDARGLRGGQVFTEGKVFGVEGIYVCNFFSSFTPFVALRERGNPARSMCVPIDQVHIYSLKK